MLSHYTNIRTWVSFVEIRTVSSKVRKKNFVLTANYYRNFDFTIENDSCTRRRRNISVFLIFNFYVNNQKIFSLPATEVFVFIFVCMRRKTVYLTTIAYPIP